MDKKTWLQRAWIAIWPYPEIARLTEKCRERSSECYLWQVKYEALKAELESAQRKYKDVRSGAGSRIFDGNNPGAVHQNRLEYENNRLRSFVTCSGRAATALQNDIARLNNDLADAKLAVIGGILPENNPG